MCALNSRASKSIFYTMLGAKNKMAERKKRILISGALGFIFTTIFAFSAYYFYKHDNEIISSILFWQNTLLQSIVPMHNIGSAEKLLYMGTALNYFMFIASFPVGFIFYSLLAYWGLRRWVKNST